MKRKIVAFLLVLTLTLSLGSATFANDHKDPIGERIITKDGV